MGLGAAAACAAVEYRDPMSDTSKGLAVHGGSTTMLGRSGKQHTASGRAPGGGRAASVGTPAPA